MGLDASGRALLKELESFVCEVSSLDRIWNVLHPDRKARWRHLNVVQYRDSHFLTRVGEDAASIEVVRGKEVRTADSPGGMPHFGGADEAGLEPGWIRVLEDAVRWLNVVRGDWIAANKRIWREYPLDRRYGTVSNALLRESLPDTYRLDEELGKSRTRKLVSLVERGYFLKTENIESEAMTSGRYFEYCRIAYLAGRRKEDKVDKTLSGREMYARYADGRHEGLLDIDPDSPQEFADWIDGAHPRRSRGGHPWEIKRGGNTTHIDLTVMRPLPGMKQGFKIELRGESMGRMVETMRMFLGIHAAGLPITIANPEGVRKRLLGQDTIGIVPSYAMLHRANQRNWAAEDVYDVVHYAALGRFKRRIAPFITWEPPPILRPRR